MSKIKNEPKLINSYLSQQNVKNVNKDSIISKLKKEVASQSKELIKLKAENADLRSRVSLIYSSEQNYKAAKEIINEIRDQTNTIIKNKDEEQKALKNKIEQMEMEKTLDELKNNRNNTLYNQKMSVVHHIEMENKAFKDEVKDLKWKNEQLNKAIKQKLESLDILNQIKFSQFKKKMIDNLKDAKENVSKLNLEYMDLNGKITILQNHQLLSEIEFQKQQIESLDKENLKLKKKIFDLEKELVIHKEVEIKLAIKAKQNINNESNSFNKKIKLKPEINIKNNDIISNLNSANAVTFLPVNKNNFKSINNNTINKEKINDILNNNVLNEYTNRASKTVSKSLTSYNQKLRISSGNNNNNYYNYASERNGISYFDFKYIKYNKILKRKNDEIEKLNITIDSLKNRFENYIGTNKALFLFLEESLNTFFDDCHKELKNKNINIDIENIKKFDFESLSKEEKYSILVILMNFLIPLITFSYNSNKKENLFKTNLNVNIINRDLPCNNVEKYMKDSSLKNAFIGKKIKNHFFNEAYSNQNYGNGNLIRVLKKNDSPDDSRIKDNKYKSLIKKIV